jgi:hypothetical protein
MIANAVNYSDDKGTVEISFSDGQGIVDGGHTYEIILENKQECPDNQFVKFEILTGITDKAMAEAIAQGLNTAVQVQEMSLANLAGKFEWIKTLLKDTPYAGEIVYKENEKGQYDIREIVGLLTLFNKDEFDDTRHPLKAYTSKAASLTLYTKPGGQVSYEKLKPLIKDILYLHDYIQLKARDLYNKKYQGKAASLAFYNTRKCGKHKLVFIDNECPSILYDGALYPILGAFRFLVEQKDGSDKYSWKPGSFKGVLKLFDQVGGDLIYITKNTSDSRGKNPNAVGKDENHWDNLYKTVALAYLQGPAHSLTHCSYISRNDTFAVPLINLRWLIIRGSLNGSRRKVNRRAGDVKSVRMESINSCRQMGMKSRIINERESFLRITFHLFACALKRIAKLRRPPLPASA